MTNVLMDRRTGVAIDDQHHLIQSIEDIVSTLIGERVLVRDYGCLFPAMLDRPVNGAWAVTSFGMLITALTKWEPRMIIKQIGIDASQLTSGVISLTISAIYKPLGRVIVLENISIQFPKD